MVQLKLHSHADPAASGGRTVTVNPGSIPRSPHILIGTAALFLHIFWHVILAAPSVAAPHPDALKIGVLAPLSGPYAGGGTSFVQAATLAVERANAEGGVFGQ